MCLVGNRRRSSLVSLTAASLVLGERNVDKDESSAQDTTAKVLIRSAPMTSELLPKTKRTFDEQESSKQPSYSRQITNSPDPRCYKKRKPSLLDGVDEEIKNSTTRTSSSAFLLSFPDDADSIIATNADASAVPPLKRARTLAFRKSTTMMTYESVKSSLFSCDMLPPSI